LLGVDAVPFEQAAIRVENEREFGALKAGFTRLFAPEKAERLLKRLGSKGIRIRDFDLVVSSGVMEALDDGLQQSGPARKLYEALTISDQAQIREFYLSKIEEVEPGLRAKYQKLYRYY
jgi:hypothetical protein